jgi:hypothetical protein
MRRLVAIVAILGVILSTLVVSGCASDSSNKPRPTGSSSSALAEKTKLRLAIEALPNKDVKNPEPAIDEHCSKYKCLEEVRKLAHLLLKAGFRLQTNNPLTIVYTKGEPVVPITIDDDGRATVESTFTDDRGMGTNTCSTKVGEVATPDTLVALMGAFQGFKGGPQPEVDLANGTRCETTVNPPATWETTTP